MLIDNHSLEDLVVVKRSGQRVEFNSLKIAVAIKNAFDSTPSNARFQLLIGQGCPSFCNSNTYEVYQASFFYH